MDKKSLLDKFLGSMIGSAVGDAIGQMAFAYPTDIQCYEDDLQRRIGSINDLVYTDDTAMAIGLIEALTEKGKLEEQHLGDIFAENFRREPWRGYAMGPPMIFSMAEEGIPYVQAAASLFDGQGSFGNGAAMRITPVGLFYYNDKELYKRVRESSIVTHSHKVAIDGAAVLALAISYAVKTPKEEEFPIEKLLSELITFAQTEEIRQKMVTLKSLLAEQASSDIAAHQLGRTVTTHESVPFALFSFLRFVDSFEQCLMCAALNGGDRDTMAAMACAVSGAYLGKKAIPEEWYYKLEHLQYLEKLTHRLLESYNL